MKKISVIFGFLLAYIIHVIVNQNDFYVYINIVGIKDFNDINKLELSINEDDREKALKIEVQNSNTQNSYKFLLQNFSKFDVRFKSTLRLYFNNYNIPTIIELSPVLMNEIAKSFSDINVKVNLNLETLTSIKFEHEDSNTKVIKLKDKDQIFKEYQYTIGNSYSPYTFKCELNDYNEKSLEIILVKPWLISNKKIYLDNNSFNLNEISTLIKETGILIIRIPSEKKISDKTTCLDNPVFPKKESDWSDQKIPNKNLDQFSITLKIEGVENSLYSYLSWTESEFYSKETIPQEIQITWKNRLNYKMLYIPGYEPYDILSKMPKECQEWINKANSLQKIIVHPIKIQKNILFPQEEVQKRSYSLSIANSIIRKDNLITNSIAIDFPDVLKKYLSNQRLSKFSFSDVRLNLKVDDFEKTSFTLQDVFNSFQISLIPLQFRFLFKDTEDDDFVKKVINNTTLTISRPELRKKLGQKFTDETKLSLYYDNNNLCYPSQMPNESISSQSISLNPKFQLVLPNNIKNEDISVACYSENELQKYIEYSKEGTTSNLDQLDNILIPLEKFETSQQIIVRIGGYKESVLSLIPSKQKRYIVNPEKLSASEECWVILDCAYSIIQPKPIFAALKESIYSFALNLSKSNKENAQINFYYYNKKNNNLVSLKSDIFTSNIFRNILPEKLDSLIFNFKYYEDLVKSLNEKIPKNKKITIWLFSSGFMGTIPKEFSANKINLLGSSYQYNIITLNIIKLSDPRILDLCKNFNKIGANYFHISSIDQDIIKNDNLENTKKELQKIVDKKLDRLTEQDLQNIVEKQNFEEEN